MLDRSACMSERRWCRLDVICRRKQLFRISIVLLQLSRYHATARVPASKSNASEEILLLLRA